MDWPIPADHHDRSELPSQIQGLVLWLIAFAALVTMQGVWWAWHWWSGHESNTT